MDGDDAHILASWMWTAPAPEDKSCNIIPSVQDDFKAGYTDHSPLLRGTKQ
jgi:hypothetical protein